MPNDFDKIQPLCLKSPYKEVHNRVYILFSPKKFTCKTTSNMDDLSVLSNSDFEEWLGQMREKDDFLDEYRDIRIYPKKNYDKH